MLDDCPVNIRRRKHNHILDFLVKLFDGTVAFVVDEKYKGCFVPNARIFKVGLNAFIVMYISDGKPLSSRQFSVLFDVVRSYGAFRPQIISDPFMGIIISTIVYAVGSGLTEVLVSPIVESCPFEHKEAATSLLHSFYCWGSVGVILLSTVFFSVFGIGNWKWLACIWAIIPLYNMFNFITCPIEHPAEDGQGMSIGNLLKTPVFIISILLMICAGASELSMAQWASAFAESALDLSKAMGDIAGPCLFAVTMGISRSLYGKYGDRLDLIKFMIGSGMLCLICYLVASLSDIPMLGLAGCIICGFSVGIMWPGTISICSGKMPSGGTAMFALLAMAGDLGGAIGPGIVGNISQSAGDDIRKGVLAGCIFPLVLVILTFVISQNVNAELSFQQKRNNRTENRSHKRQDCD